VAPQDGFHPQNNDDQAVSEQQKGPPTWAALTKSAKQISECLVRGACSLQVTRGKEREGRKKTQESPS